MLNPIFSKLGMSRKGGVCFQDCHSDDPLGGRARGRADECVAKILASLES